jgi:hypothetical protein
MLIIVDHCHQKPREDRTANGVIHAPTELAFVIDKEAQCEGDPESDKRHDKATKVRLSKVRRRFKECTALSSQSNPIVVLK